MLARIRNAKENGESGFTLIELLVVMIIIGILAAIAIPAFLNQKKKAAETAAKSDATNISKEIAAALVDGPLVAAPTIAPKSGGTASDYVLTVQTTADTTPVAVDVRVSSGNIPAIGAYSPAPTATATKSTYCVQVTPNADTSGIWSASQNGLKKGVCATS